MQPCIRPIGLRSLSLLLDNAIMRDMIHIFGLLSHAIGLRFEDELTTRQSASLFTPQPACHSDASSQAGRNQYGTPTLWRVSFNWRSVAFRQLVKGDFQHEGEGDPGRPGRRGNAHGLICMGPMIRVLWFSFMTRSVFWGAFIHCLSLIYAQSYPQPDGERNSLRSNEYSGNKNIGEGDGLLADSTVRPHSSLQSFMWIFDGIYHAGQVVYLVVQ